jgi:hypothetical protein
MSKVGVPLLQRLHQHQQGLHCGVSPTIRDINLMRVRLFQAGVRAGARRKLERVRLRDNAPISARRVRSLQLAVNAHSLGRIHVELIPRPTTWKPGL